MIYGLYSIRDRVTGIYDSPFPSVNDNSAKRDFRMLIKNPKYNYQNGDLELYKIGTLDSSSGELVSNDSGKPIYLDKEEADTLING